MRKMQFPHTFKSIHICCGIHSIRIGETIGLEGENPKLALVKTGHVFFSIEKSWKLSGKG